MGRLIVDTGVLIRAERSPESRALPIEDEDDVVIAALTVAELLVGVERANADRRPARSRFVERVLGALPVVDYGTVVAREHAALLAHTAATGRPRGAHDLIVAATARAEQRVLLTTDGRAFDGLPGVEVRVVAAR